MPTNLTEEQVDLFNPKPTRKPMARKTDPLSSHVAADRIERSGKVTKQQKAALAAVCCFPGLTTRELARATVREDRPYFAPLGSDEGSRVHALGRRLSELIGTHLRPPREVNPQSTRDSRWFAQPHVSRKWREFNGDGVATPAGREKQAADRQAREDT